MGLGLWVVAADEGAARKEAALPCGSVITWNSSTGTTPEGPAN
jgi:hypothetical protein